MVQVFWDVYTGSNDWWLLAFRRINCVHLQSQRTPLLMLLEPEDKETIVLRNICRYLTEDMSEYFSFPCQYRPTNGSYFLPLANRRWCISSASDNKS
jgi:hypothetical protein